MSWTPETFLIAMPGGPAKRHGYVYRGLGLYLIMPASPKGRRPAQWSLTHLGSGHCLAMLKGDVSTAFPIATEIAEAGDWTFDGLKGWKNHFPDAAERVREILERAGSRGKMTGGGNSNEGVAREIAMARST